MCLVDSSSSVDIDPGELSTTQYRCMDCKAAFRALGKKVRCPSCDSVNVRKV